MASKFIELLNLNEKLRSKISIFQVKPRTEGKKTFYQIFFEASENLNADELLELVRKVTRFESIKVKSTDIFISQPTEATEAHEIYSVLRFILDSFMNINHSHYIVCLENDKAIIKTVKQNTHDKLQKFILGVIKLLENFGIWTSRVTVELDSAALDYSHFNARKNKKMNAKQERERTNPAVVDGYKLVNPLTIREDEQKAYFEGKVFQANVKKTRKGQLIWNAKIAKDHKALSVIKFCRTEEEVPDNAKKGAYIRVYGNLKYSSYSKEYQINSESIQILDESLIKAEVIDNAPFKRVELHTHTKMSQMDGVGSVAEYASRAKELGMSALAITDHNSVQAFPDAVKYGWKDKNFKFIYGVELDVVDDLNTVVVYNEKDKNLRDAEYVFYDIETTGISPLNHEVIEFGGVKVRNGQVVDRLQIFVNPSVEISEQTTQLTGIKQTDVAGQPELKEVIPKISEFFGDAILVAHNARFDHTFLNAHFRKFGYPEIQNTTIDSMKISWILNPGARAHNLGAVCRTEGVIYDPMVAHRADYDAEVLYNAFENMLMKLLESGIRNVLDLNKKILELHDYIFTDHITVYAKNQAGLKELYKIVTEANTTFFNKRKKSAQIPLSNILGRRENLLIGSACNKGMAFEAASQDLKELGQILKYFDFIEIFPTSVYQGEIAKGFYTRNEIQNVLRKLYAEATDQGIITVATGNVHYANREDKIARDIYISAPGLGGRPHPLWDRKNPKYIKPDQHLRSTDEMLGSMKRIFKSDEIAEEIVVTNSNKISDMIEVVKPLKKDLYTPKIPGAREEFIRLIKYNTKRLYGDTPPEWIQKRIDREVEAITKYSYDIVYYLSSLAVRKSLQDGYLVGSRGSVGSSIVATLTDITEVNPLEPHYRCDNCKHVEKVEGVGSGYDLPHTDCPVCASEMKGEGQDIPFETFLGFEGDKVPDIDLNFSGDYQTKIHHFIKEELGEKNVFRAGTISTVAEKTAYGYTRGYFEKMEEEAPSNTTMEYLASIVEGTKRTTGQHPGGLIVVPDELDIEDFSPINYPGNDANAEWKTTHFDFHSIHDNLLKLDFLGHIDPSAIRMLEDITGLNSQKDIDMNDQDVISLFIGNEALNIKKKYLDEDLGIIGVPEFGTGFVRELVRDAKPKSFADLVRVSGLSHGTDVWLGNAKEIIDKGIGELKDVISVRDDIMTYLIRHGVKPKSAFTIMELVRKGQFMGNPSRMEFEKEMRDAGVPEWYIESAKKIKYMFPKAHASAYVMMAFRIAWFKINYPLAYYATFFTKRDTEWDIDVMYGSPEDMLKYRDKVKKMGWEASDKEKNTSATLLIVLEMYSRGYKIADFSLEKSHATDWQVDEENGALIPPFNIMEGLGDSVATRLTTAREQQEFLDINDFKARSGLSRTLQDKFRDLGILGNMQTQQDKVFNIFDDFE